eukprot:RCo015854
MAVLSADPANMALLGNEGGVDIVMNFLRQYPGLPAVAADSLGCLASLSQAEEIRQILEEDGGMETVVEHTFAPLGGSGGADPLPQALLNGLRALLNFCVSEALRVSACRAGLVTGLVSTLNLISSLEARQAALNIMLILSSPTQDVEASMEIQEFLVSNGAARALAPLLGEPTVGSQEATIAGTVLLRILSFNEVIYPELAESASAIMSALERHSGNQDLAVVCLELLSALSSQEKLHPAVLGESSASSEALIRALLSTLRIHGEAPELVLRVLFALGNFTVQLVVQHGLVSGGGVPILLNILNSAVLPAVAQGCCKVLENLCSLDREHLVPKLREQGCGKGLVTALAKHSGSGQTDVLQAVLRVLQSLAGSADDNSPQAIQGHQELIAAGILPGLLPLLNMEVAVAAQVLYLLLTLSVDISEEIRSSVCTPGGFEALARAVVEKAHSGELLQCAMPLLVRLAGGAATTLAHVATTLPSFLTSVVGMLASPTEGKGSAVVPIASAQLCAILSSTDPKVAEHLSVLDALQHLSKLASSASESPEATEHVVSSAHAVASILVHGGEPALTAAQSLAPSLRALVAKAVENPMPEPHAQLCQAALQRLTAATEPASTSSPAEDSPAPAEHSATAEVPPPPAPSESADQQQQQQQQQQQELRPPEALVFSSDGGQGFPNGGVAPLQPAFPPADPGSSPRQGGQGFPPSVVTVIQPPRILPQQPPAHPRGAPFTPDTTMISSVSEAASSPSFLSNSPMALPRQRPQQAQSQVRTGQRVVRTGRAKAAPAPAPAAAAEWISAPQQVPSPRLAGSTQPVVQCIGPPEMPTTLVTPSGRTGKHVYTTVKTYYNTYLTADPPGESQASGPSAEVSPAAFPTAAPSPVAGPSYPLPPPSAVECIPPAGTPLMFPSAPQTVCTYVVPSSSTMGPTAGPPQLFDPRAPSPAFPFAAASGATLGAATPNVVCSYVVPPPIVASGVPGMGFPSFPDLQQQQNQQLQMPWGTMPGVPYVVPAPSLGPSVSV